MLNIKIGKESYNNVIGFEIMRNHGLSKIIENGSKITYDGYYNGNHFVIQSTDDYGQMDYDLLSYNELYNDVKIDEELTQLIDFIENKEVVRAYKNDGKSPNYGRIN